MVNLDRSVAKVERQIDLLDLRLRTNHEHIGPFLLDAMLTCKGVSSPDVEHFGISEGDEVQGQFVSKLFILRTENIGEEVVGVDAP